MKLINQSPRPLSQLRPLISFVRSQFAPVVRRCELSIVPAEQPKLSSAGLAKRRSDGSHLVTIYLAGEGVFPCLTKHPKVDDVGHIRLNSWEEEFIFVLAHELMHIAQFSAGTYPDKLNEHQAEVEAEEMGYEVLLRWRRAQIMAQLAA